MDKIKFNKYNLLINSDYEIRKVYEDENDLDLFIQLERRTLNIFFKDMPAYLDQRFQLNNVNSIIVRISKLENNNKATIHFLENIDLHSSLVNFILDYTNLEILIKEEDFSTNLYIKER